MRILFSPSVSGEPLSDGISPKQGCDKNGPVAILQSESCLEQVKNRNGTMMKVPYMVVVGGKDEAAGMISVRARTGGDKGQMRLEDFMSTLGAELEG